MNTESEHNAEPKNLSIPVICERMTATISALNIVATTSGAIQDEAVDDLMKIFASMPTYTQIIAAQSKQLADEKK
jgi:hypothetical protein